MRKLLFIIFICWMPLALSNTCKDVFKSSDKPSGQNKGKSGKKEIMVLEASLNHPFGPIQTDGKEVAFEVYTGRPPFYMLHEGEGNIREELTLYDVYRRLVDPQLGASQDKMFVLHVLQYPYNDLSGFLQDIQKREQPIHGDRLEIKLEWKLLKYIASLSEGENSKKVLVEGTFDNFPYVNYLTFYTDNLLAAVGRGDLPAVKRIVREESPDIHAQDSGGYTVLHIAVHAHLLAKKLSKKTYLMEHYGMTLGKSWLAIAHFLLDKGADPTLKDVQGKTPIDLARDKADREAEQLLLSYVTKVTESLGRVDDTIEPPDPPDLK